MKFSIRDLMLVTVIVALAVGWWVDRTCLKDDLRIARVLIEIRTREVDDFIERTSPYRQFSKAEPPQEQHPSPLFQFASFGALVAASLFGVLAGWIIASRFNARQRALNSSAPSPNPRNP